MFLATYSQKRLYWREFNPSFGLPLYKSTSACSPAATMSFGVDATALKHFGLHLKVFTGLYLSQCHIAVVLCHIQVLHAGREHCSIFQSQVSL